MEITFKNERYDQIVIVKQNNPDLTASQVVEVLVRPAMLALGYHPASLVSVLGEVNDDALFELAEERAALRELGISDEA